MKIYDGVIQNVLDELTGCKCEVQWLESGRISDGSEDWPDAGRQNIVLRNDMAYELGADKFPAVSFLGLTSSKNLVNGSAAYLYGDDLQAITTGGAYAKIVILRVDQGEDLRDEVLYDLMNRIQKTRYQINPSGFMSRISTSQCHEPVRVSKNAIKQGLNFQKISRLMMKSYKQHKEVMDVQIHFVTLKDFNYIALQNYANKVEEITVALNHVLKNFQMDCSSCKLQAICSEAEELRSMHYK